MLKMSTPKISGDELLYFSIIKNSMPIFELNFQKDRHDSTIFAGFVSAVCHFAKDCKMGSRRIVFLMSFIFPPHRKSHQFDVVLKTVGDKKIQVIKVVRELTSLGLKEAKDLVDSAPKKVVESQPKDKAEQIKAKLEEVGATCEIA